MLVQTPLDGAPAWLSQIGEGYRGPLPPPTVKDVRALLACSLVELGLSQLQVGQLINMPRSTVNEAVRSSVEPEVDESLPPDEPPVIKAPAPRQKQLVVKVSPKLVASLRRCYGPGVETDDGRRLGELPEVAEWLGTLKPGQVAPRAGPP